MMLTNNDEVTVTLPSLSEGAQKPGCFSAFQLVQPCNNTSFLYLPIAHFLMVRFLFEAIGHNWILIS